VRKLCFRQDVNVEGTCNILEAGIKNGIKKVVYASSVWAASRGFSVPYLPIDENTPCKPEGMYDITKRMGEEFCEYFYRMYGLSTIIFRLFGFSPKLFLQDVVRQYYKNKGKPWAEEGSKNE